MKRNYLTQGRDMVREVVRKRDKYRCQDCKKRWGENMRRFDIHHLNGLCGKKSRGYDRVADIAGLITYCHKCHMSKHAAKKNSQGVNLKEHKKEIVGLLTTMSYDAVAKKFGVSQAAVWNMVHRTED